jgi:hypothetical protein
MFDLDFPGGSPQELVETLNKPLGGKLNVIIPPEYNDIQIPGLKMRNVTVAQVFDALGQSSVRRVAYETGATGLGGGNTRKVVQEYTESYGFRTTAPITENSVWSFHVERPAQSPGKLTDKACRYYQLGPYLETLKIDDITTAIQTGWKMLNAQNPVLQYHPETKLLVAVGKPNELVVIDDVIRELAKNSTSSKSVDSILDSRDRERKEKPGF